MTNKGNGRKTVPKTKVRVKKKLSSVQSYALISAREAANRAAKELQSMINEVAKEVGIDTESNEIWGLSDDCTFFSYRGVQPKVDEEKKEDES